MQKFWNADKLCLYDVIEPLNNSGALPDQSMRPNQLLAVGLPHRAFTTQQEKSILLAVEAELLTPMGLRTLTTADPGYQGMYGCGIATCPTTRAQSGHGCSAFTAMP
jgi:predicted glycogen debranching enzyme